MLRSFDGVEPTVHEDAYVDPATAVTGDVTLEADASVQRRGLEVGVAGDEAVGADHRPLVDDRAVQHRRARPDERSLPHFGAVDDCGVANRRVGGRFCRPRA